jgi:hypothetical protein
MDGYNNGNNTVTNYKATPTAAWGWPGHPMGQRVGYSHIQKFYLFFKINNFSILFYKKN